MPREHTWYECTRQHDDGGVNCMFCEGGLGHCTVCDGFEGTLPTDCPGRKIGKYDQELIYKGTLDYRGDCWLRRPLEDWETTDPKRDEKDRLVDQAVLRLNVHAMCADASCDEDPIGDTMLCETHTKEARRPGRRG